MGIHNMMNGSIENWGKEIGDRKLQGKADWYMERTRTENLEKESRAK